jgi:hypothetical protein
MRDKQTVAWIHNFCSEQLECNNTARSVTRISENEGTSIQIGKNADAIDGLGTGTCNRSDPSNTYPSFKQGERVRCRYMADGSSNMKFYFATIINFTVGETKAVVRYDDQIQNFTVETKYIKARDTTVEHFKVDEQIEAIYLGCNSAYITSTS